MTETLAVEVLYDAVVARFTSEGVNAVNVFGWREPAKHVEGNRVAWVPGDPSGKVGLTGPARNPGRNPRPLATLHELFTVWITASDPTDPENERAQYKATRVLRDLWHRAVYKAAHGTFSIRDEEWDRKRTERQYGATLRVVVELQSMVPDVVQAVAPVDTRGSITVVLQTSAESPDAIDPGDNTDTGEGGSGGVTKKYTAGEAVSALRVVRFQTGVDNQVVLARPPEAESLAPIGVTANAAGSGDEVTVVVDGGELSDSSWGWIPGAPVLMGELGVLTQTASPDLPFVLVVGVAIAAETIVVRIEPAIYTA